MPWKQLFTTCGAAQVTLDLTIPYLYVVVADMKYNSWKFGDPLGDRGFSLSRLVSSSAHTLRVPSHSHLFLLEGAPIAAFTGPLGRNETLLDGNILRIEMEGMHTNTCLASRNAHQAGVGYAHQVAEGDTSSVQGQVNRCKPRPRAEI